eukprot:scaffold3135_cov195-Pinguiococcus_pyrenoidosus.AAC.1
MASMFMLPVAVAKTIPAAEGLSTTGEKPIQISDGLVENSVDSMRSERSSAADDAEDFGPSAWRASRD